MLVSIEKIAVFFRLAFTSGHLDPTQNEMKLLKIQIHTLYVTLLKELQST